MSLEVAARWSAVMLFSDRRLTSAPFAIKKRAQLNVTFLDCNMRQRFIRASLIVDNIR